jgi:hypothetical protein
MEHGYVIEEESMGNVTTKDIMMWMAMIAAGYFTYQYLIEKKVLT